MRRFPHKKFTMLKRSRYCLAVIIIHCLTAVVYAQNPEIKVDLKQEIAPLTPVWAWFGYDEPNYTYMKDGKKLLSEIKPCASLCAYT